MPDSAIEKLKKGILQDCPSCTDLIQDIDIKKAKRKLEKKKTGFRMESGENASSTKL